MKRKRKPKGRVRVGRYVMHDAVIVVYVDMEARDSQTVFAWNEYGYIEMTIGLKHDHWTWVMDGMLHEVIETGMMLEKASHIPAESLKQHGADAYVFMLDHPKFTRLIRHAADILQHLIPEIKRLWRKRNRGE
jgi:hypothetical protein